MGSPKGYYQDRPKWAIHCFAVSKAASGSREQ